MSRLRHEHGIALPTTIILVAIMLLIGTALLGVVITQANQTTKDRAGESAFNLAEATLNAEAFLLGRNWPQAPVVGTCDVNTLTGNLTDPGTVASPTLTQQVQSILAQTYNGSGSPAASTWHVTACAEGARNAWDASLLNGAAYDDTFATPGPRRMWVRAEGLVEGRRRAVVGLVQAGRQSVFPSNLAVVTGRMGSDLTTTSSQAVTGQVVGPLLTSLVGGSGKLYDGTIGLRCSLLDQSLLPTCLNGVYKATSMTTVAPLLQGNSYYDFRSDQTISNDLIAQLRQQAKTSGTYYANTSPSVGGVANGSSCLPSSPSPAGKVIFIEQIGDGTGSCIVNTTGNPSANAVVVGAGGVRVCPNSTCAAVSAAPNSSNRTFTGVIYALHRKAPLQGGRADVQIEGGSQVFGGVYVDDNPSLASADRHGFVNVIPPPINMTAVLNSITSTLPLCQIPIVGPITCSLTTLLGQTLDQLLGTLGISATTLASAIVTQLNPSLPAVKYDAATVNAVKAMGDSALVPGTFRQVQPRY